MRIFLPSVFILTYWINPLYAFLLISLLLIFLLTGKIYRKEKIVFFVKDWIYIFYLFFCIIPLFLVSDQFDYFIKIALFPFFLILFFQNIPYSEPEVYRRINKILFVSLIIFSIMFFQASPMHFDFSIDYIIHVNRDKYFYYLSDEKTGPTASANMLSMMFLIFISKYKFMVSTKKLVNLFFILGLMPFILLVGGRNAFVGIVSLILLYVSYGDRAQKSAIKKKILFLIFIILCLILTYILLSPFLPTDFQERLIGFTNPLEDKNVLSRIVYWLDALNLIKNNPLGLGFNYFYQKHNITPHNEILGQLIGPVGLVLSSL